jgi:PhnB protein
MTFTPYIHFQGNCAEAMTFYAAVFGGDLALTRYSDMPDGPPDFAESDLILHAMLAVPNATLLGSDYPPGEEGDPQKAVSISYDAPDLVQAQSIFDKLLDGGSQIMPFEATFWSPGFGMLKDRFGTHWMISVPNPA